MTIYYANPVGKKGSELQARMNDLFRDGSEIAYIDTPEQWNTRPENVRWCADNGCFSPKKSLEGIPWDEDGWWNWLVANAPHADRCDFANAPDVVHMTENGPVGDAAATLERSRPWLAKIRALGYPVGYVAQDGFDPTVIPWDDIDVLFIGGSDNFKIGPHGLRLDGTPKGEVPAALAIKEAQARGKKVHIGRVNSRQRFRFAVRLGADSVDGTYATFAPDRNVANILSWIREQATFRTEAPTDRAVISAAAAEWDNPESVAEGFNQRVLLPDTDTYLRDDQTLVATFSPSGRLLHATHFDGSRYESDVTAAFAVDRLSRTTATVTVRVGAPFQPALRSSGLRDKVTAAHVYKDGSIVLTLTGTEATDLRTLAAQSATRSARAVLRALR
jgi:hypothetical protein